MSESAGMPIYRWDAHERTEGNADVKEWYLYIPRESSKGIRFENELDCAYYWINEYLQKLRSKSRKDATVYTYQDSMHNVVEFLHTHGMRCDPMRITEVEIQFFINNYEVSESTIKYYLNKIKLWLSREHGNQVVQNMDILWNDNECPNVIHLSHEDYMKLWDNVNDPTDRIILAFGGRCGLRREEICRLKLGDIDIEKNIIVIHGKGHGKGKIRTFPITEGMKEELNLWMEHRQYIIDTSSENHSGDALIVVRNFSNCYPIKKTTVWDRIRKLGIKCKVKVTPHALRRHYVTYYAENMTLDMLVSLCKSVGWRSIDLLLRYLAENKTKLAGLLESKENQYI